MRVSDLIDDLQDLKEEHGNLEVETYNFCMDRVPVLYPYIRYKMILTGRLRKPSFWIEGIDEKLKGDKVIFL